MSDESSGYRDPQLAINRVYTRKGDGGKTALVGGQKVPKDDLRIDAYGTVDELNAFVGVARLTLRDSAHPDLNRLADTLLRIQHELFNLGSILATLPEDVHPQQPRVRDLDVAALEQGIDTCNAELPPLRSFVLPGGTRAGAELHVARTVCRRAERAIVRLAATTEVDPWCIAYLNRLSDALFVWSRYAVHCTGADETLWHPNQATSGRP